MNAATRNRGGALVTGAGRRIGRAIALNLADLGYAVAVHYREHDGEARAVVEEITRGGGRAGAVRADLTREAETQSLVAEAVAAVGPLTLLVNNASLFEDDRVGGLTRQSWDGHMETNLRAPLVLAQAFAAQAAQAATRDAASDPLIVNVLDQRVWKPNPQFFSYTLSKAGLWTATRMLAQALAPRIRVNAIGPGPTLASIHQGPGEFDAEAEATPLGRRVSPDDICAALRYLIGARMVTGQMIAVDAGQHLAWRTPDIAND